MSAAISTGCAAGPPTNAALCARVELIEQPAGTDHPRARVADTVGESSVTGHDDHLLPTSDAPLRLGDDLVIPLAGGQHENVTRRRNMSKKIMCIKLMQNLYIRKNGCACTCMTDIIHV